MLLVLKVFCTVNIIPVLNRTGTSIYLFKPNLLFSGFFTHEDAIDIQSFYIQYI